MPVSKSDLDKLQQAHEDIQKNMAFYVKTALTEEQTIAMNKVTRDFYRHNKSIREIESIDYAFA